MPSRLCELLFLVFEHACLYKQTRLVNRNARDLFDEAGHVEKISLSGMRWHFSFNNLLQRVWWNVHTLSITHFEPYLLHNLSLKTKSSVQELELHSSDDDDPFPFIFPQFANLRKLTIELDEDLQWNYETPLEQHVPPSSLDSLCIMHVYNDNVEELVDLLRHQLRTLEVCGVEENPRGSFEALEKLTLNNTGDEILDIDLPESVQCLTINDCDCYQLPDITTIVKDTLVLSNNRNLPSAHIVEFACASAAFCRHLDLSYNIELDNTDLEVLCQTMKQVQVFKLVRCIGLTALPPQSLGRMLQLQELNLNECYNLEVDDWPDLSATRLSLLHVADIKLQRLKTHCFPAAGIEIRF